MTEKPKSLFGIRFRRDWLFYGVGVWYYGGLLEDGGYVRFRVGWPDTNRPPAPYLP